jgi:hypothetical protein
VTQEAEKSREDIERAAFEKGYEQGVNEVLSEVKTVDPDLYRCLCAIFNPARR